MWKLLPVILLFTNHLYGDETDFYVSVSLSKQQVVRYEPVVLKVNIENTSGKRQDICHLVRPELKILLIDPDGKQHELPFLGIDALEAQERDKPRLMTLSTDRVGYSVHRRIVLIPSPGNWLDKPGKYTLGALFQYTENPKDLTGSPIVTLTVKKAKGVNKKALERFRGHPQARYFAGGSSCRDIALEFQTVLREYPESVYTPWCYYALARAEQYDPYSPEKGRSTSATMYFDTLLEKYSNFPLKLEIEYELARELIRLGKPEEAFYEIKKLANLDTEADNRNAELYLFYEARKVLEAFGDGNKKKIEFDDLPSH